MKRWLIGSLAFFLTFCFGIILVWFFIVDSLQIRQSPIKSGTDEVVISTPAVSQPPQIVSVEKVNPQDAPTEVNTVINESERTASELCRKLKQIKIMPYEAGEVTGDPIYDGLMAKGKGAIPCLVEKITDAKVIDDPRIGDPHVHGFTVGDAAAFILCDITGVSL